MIQGDSCDNYCNDIMVMIAKCQIDYDGSEGGDCKIVIIE